MGVLLDSGLYVPSQGEWGTDRLTDNWELLDAHLLDTGIHGGGGGGVSLGTTVTGPPAFGAAAVVGSSGTASKSDHVHGLPANPVTAHVALPDAHHAEDHKAAHATGGGDAFAVTDLLDAVARVGVRKGTGTTFNRRRISLNEGTGITLTVADDSGSEEVDVTIAATGGGESGAPDPHASTSHEPGVSVFPLLSGSAGEQALGTGYLSFVPATLAAAPASGRRLQSDTANGGRLTVKTPTQTINLETAAIATATGDLLYASSSGVLTRLGIGSTNDVLRVSGGVPDWEPLDVITTPMDIITANTTGLTPTASIADRSATPDDIDGIYWSANLQGYTEMNLGIMVRAVSGDTTEITLQYSTNGGSSWSYIDATAGQADLGCNTLDSNNAPLRETGWFNIASGALSGDIDLRAVFHHSGGTPGAITIRQYRALIR